MTETIYLDYAATSPVDPAVADAMTSCLRLDGTFANPASTHAPGAEAKARVERAREQVAARVGAEPDEIIFTSGATESNNLAIQGTFGSSEARPRRFVTTRIEHKSVLDTAKALMMRGIGISYLSSDADGRVLLEELCTMLDERPTGLVSVMHVNNEIGTIQDVAAIAELCRAKGALLHVDAAQSAGKVEMALDEWGVDLCSLTAHKICGPKGIGALYVRRDAAIARLVHGGDQERGLRAGTLPTHQIVGMGEAYALADPAANAQHVGSLRQRFLRGLAELDDVRVNGSTSVAVPNIVNLCFPGVEGESLRLALADLAVSAGSACNADTPEPSYVLKSLGLSDTLATSSLRFSFGRFTTAREIDAAVRRILTEVNRLRALAPHAPTWCRA
jgi:cysteine desulfurase